ncbi:MAG: RNA-binding S4 domain-containing protein [Synergistetes bacterium]|nr:RNA-binding S4 domain-containing protein [Synergistota bacterium]
MRLDKFLKVSGIVRRRSVAVEMIRDQRVYLNDESVKPSKEVKGGDCIKVLFPTRVVEFKVLSVGRSKRDIKVEEW